MRILHSDSFTFPLPEGHTFPLQKYSMLRQRLVESGVVGTHELRIPRGAADAEIERAHSAGYWHSARSGELGSKEMRRIGLPWSPELVERARRSCGGTIEACQAALVDGCAINLAGGTHHAFRDHGAGYCMLNDSAIAARAMQAAGLCRWVVIIDCDVHQGDGTAAIFADDPTVTTFSIHGASNFPFHKQRSDLDIELPDGADDSSYLQALEWGLQRILAMSAADLAIYLAGADPYRGDRLGRLSLTKEGLLERDRLVLRYLRNAGVPVTITMGGGYGRQIEDTVDIHVQTVRTACEAQSTRCGDIRRSGQ
jgi:acetoin utilization deacetylase AcuC-like enzyme